MAQPIFMTAERGIKCRVSAQGRVAHAEAGADVFRDQFDGGAVSYRVRLGQIFHGFDQQTLPIGVPGVGSTLASSTSNVGSNRDRENLGHENPNIRAANRCVLCSAEVCAPQYNARLSVFQLLSFRVSPGALHLTLR